MNENEKALLEILLKQQKNLSTIANSLRLLVFIAGFFFAFFLVSLGVVFYIAYNFNLTNL